MPHAELPLWDDKSDAQKIETLKQMVDQLYDAIYADARYDLYEMLQDAITDGDKEANDITTMKKMLLQYPNIMSSSCEVGHFTGSALVCDNQGRVLLHFHKSLNRWLQFGGHADVEESDFATVAMRETIEETGLKHLIFFPNREKPVPIDFDIHVIPARKNRPEHLHLDLRYMLLTIDPESLNPPDEESQQMIWRPYDDFINPSDPSDAEQIDPALKRLIRKCKTLYYQRPTYKA